MVLLTCWRLTSNKFRRCVVLALILGVWDVLSDAFPGVLWLHTIAVVAFVIGLPGAFKTYFELKEFYYGNHP
ncbi:UNVERIFIED_CONTAM: hypothetical protein RF648_21500, partial [Kocuria sp. CPCC 205274]